MGYNNILKKWLISSYLTKSNQSYIEKLYTDFIENPNSVESSWVNVFKMLSIDDKKLIFSSPITYKNEYRSQENTLNDNDSFAQKNNSNVIYAQIFQLINAFRMYGHQYATLDPLGITDKNKYKNDFLELENYNFTSCDFKQYFDMAMFGICKGLISLESIYTFLKKTYCGNCSVEYMYIDNIDKINWIQKKLELTTDTVNTYSQTEKKQFFKEIVAAEELERYLGMKFPGSKRFSLEGGDVLIPMLKEIIRYSASCYKSKEIFFGMAHRGRLNVLINVLGKNPQDLFNEFSDKNQFMSGTGDVKYHQGFYSNIIINSNLISLSLLPNPSHLEIISPIIMGSARARIDQLFQKKFRNNLEYNPLDVILPVIIHGDAAISGQGIVQETFNMSNTRAYNVGGAVHIVINNQIGFTTSNIHDLRSTKYCTDIAKMVQAPIFHVNADDVESVIAAVRIALDFRNIFKNDVMIDLVCYRRHGHNEADDPSVTQPFMYEKINNHPTVCKIYFDYLTKNRLLGERDNIDIVNDYRIRLENEQCMISEWNLNCTNFKFNVNDLNQKKDINSVNYKKIDNQQLKNLACRISDIPLNIKMHPRVKKIYHERMEMALGNRLFDWGGSETLAYATLLDQGISVRLSGEDVSRGTFFHRHVVIHDQNSDQQYIPLMNISTNQGSFFIWDSVLSEEAAVAFEYGYSKTSNNTLVIWEAQFGDFANGAQVVIDQFISSGELKWNQLCGLVMFLPHGYEGQGPEHSSARIERYLQLCAEYNMKVCVPSNPAQIYHLLREHAINCIQKPLIIISPKSLLRNPMATSSLEDLSDKFFVKVFDELDKQFIVKPINKVIICTGKIYYDLLSQRKKHKKCNIVIIRIEQLYPFPEEEIKIILRSYIKHTNNFIWCQEEPENQGAWYYIQRFFCRTIPDVTLTYVGRSISAAPAVGSMFIHKEQQKELINNALI